MSERRQRAAALVAACLLAALRGLPAAAQQGAPPPAVLVQPAELKPIAAQAEFIGRAAAVDKVELRARVKGFLGPRKFNDGDEVKEGPGPVHHRARALPGGGRPEGPARRRRRRPSPTPNSVQARRRTAAHQHRHAGDLDQRLTEQLQAKARLEDAEAAAARRRDPALLHRDQVADRRPHRPRRGVARQPGQARVRRARHGGEREPDPRAVSSDAARASGGASATAASGERAGRARCGWPTAASTTRRASSTSSTSGRSQDRRPDRARRPSPTRTSC